MTSARSPSRSPARAFMPRPLSRSPLKCCPVTIAGRDENPGETRLTLNLGAANLDMAAIQIETAEPLFTRQVTLAVPQIAEDCDSRTDPGTGSDLSRRGRRPAALRAIWPCPWRAGSAPGNCCCSSRTRTARPCRSLPCAPSGGRFISSSCARSAGVHYLLTGNSRCAAPSYDLAALGANLKAVRRLAPQAFAAGDNPNYRPPEVLAGIQEGGTALDVSAWKFRKAVKLSSRRRAANRTRPRRALARAARLRRPAPAARRQTIALHPRKRTSISRSLTPTVTTATDKKDPEISRWIIKLPRPACPSPASAAARGLRCSGGT